MKVSRSDVPVRAGTQPTILQGAASLGPSNLKGPGAPSSGRSPWPFKLPPEPQGSKAPLLLPWGSGGDPKGQGLPAAATAAGAPGPPNHRRSPGAVLMVVAGSPGPFKSPKGHAEGLAGGVWPQPHPPPTLLRTPAALRTGKSLKLLSLLARLRSNTGVAG